MNVFVRFCMKIQTHGKAKVRWSRSSPGRRGQGGPEGTLIRPPETPWTGSLTQQRDSCKRNITILS